MNERQPNPIEKENLPLRQQKLTEHLHDSHLSQAETVAIIGTRIQLGKEELEEDLDSGALSREGFGNGVQASMRALSIIDAWDPDTNILAEAERKHKNLLMRQQDYNPGHPNRTKNETEAEAMRLIIENYRYVAIDGPQEAAGNAQGAERSAREIEFINTLISEHNDTLESPEQKDLKAALGSQSLPEMVPNEPVEAKADRESAAREKLEALEGNAIVGAALKASKGTALVTTDMPPHNDHELVQFGQLNPHIGPGFQLLGERRGDGDGANARYSRFKIPSDKVAAESVFFKHLTEPVYETRTQEERGGLFGRKITTSEQRVKVGERSKMMINPYTGLEEATVEVLYQFMSNQDHIKNPSGEQIDYPTQGGRPGNMLAVNIQLPESMASNLEEALKKNPNLARQLAKEVAVSDRTGLTEDDWSGKDNVSDNRFKVEPPYEKLSPGWTLSVYNEDAKTETEVAFN